jgi:hypothetical protein
MAPLLLLQQLLLPASSPAPPPPLLLLVTRALLLLFPLLLLLEMPLPSVVGWLLLLRPLRLPVSAACGNTKHCCSSCNMGGLTRSAM